MTMPDGTIRTFRVPFGHPAVNAFLEYLIVDLQYTRYILFGKAGWKIRLGNVISLIAITCKWALLRLRGNLNPDGTPVDFSNEENRGDHDGFQQRINSFAEDEGWMYNQMLEGLHRAFH